MFSHFLRKLANIVGRSRFAPPSRTKLVAGICWHGEPAAFEMFGPAGPDLAVWQSSGLMEVVKENLQRTIWRVRLNTGTVYVKQCRTNTPRSKAREIIRPAKARLEYENASALRTLGIGAIEPLAWGTAPGWLPSDTFLITRAQPDAVPFLDFLEHTLPGMTSVNSRAVQRQIARAFAQFIAKLHDAGVSHPDPHPGNFLIELPPSRVPRFFLIDLHAIHFGQPLSWQETKENLVLLNRWFQLRSNRTDRLRFWKMYLNARQTCTVNQDSDAVRMVNELEQATQNSNNRFWTARLARYVTNNRDSKKIRSRHVRGFAIREVLPEVLHVWKTDPDAVFLQPGVRILKDSRSSTVAEISMNTPSGEQTIIFKRFSARSWLSILKNCARQSPAMRSWILGNNVRDRGLPTARPLAVLYRKRFGIQTTGYLAFEKVPDAVPLTEAISQIFQELHPDRMRIVRAWADEIGQLIRKMHDRQVRHRDLKAPNLLMSGFSDPQSAKPILIDLVGVELGHSISQALRAKDLARLNTSFRESPHITRTDRLRLLRAYLRWKLHGGENWKEWWKEIDWATQVKVRKNTRSGRPLG